MLSYGTRRQWLRGLLALGSLLSGAALAWHHPLSPLLALAILGLGCTVAAAGAGAWLLLIPASLPFLNFSPWTGWLVLDEFDILLLGSLAGAYGRWVWDVRTGRSRALVDVGSASKIAGHRFAHVLLALWGAWGLFGLWRGVMDAGGLDFDWFAGYAEALNSLRVFKSLGFALLFLPLLRQAVTASAAQAGRQLATGVVLGLGGVTLAIVWERATYPGLIDFSAPYRTVALFWEMHVGGAAIDAYLVLTAPFVVWAVLSARRAWHWIAAAVLSLLMGYACLTSFSRGVYLAVALPLLLLARWLRAQKTGPVSGGLWQSHWPADWRGKANAMLVLALTVELVAVWANSSFMMQRMANADRDWGGRLAHWQQGLALLHGPADWLLGKGLGRFPANYARHAVQGEFSGTAQRHEEIRVDGAANTFVTLRGPASSSELTGLFRLSQRVGSISSGQHSVALSIRVRQATDLRLELCERHLLYSGNCQVARIRVTSGEPAWQSLRVALNGPPARVSPWYAPRFGVFSLSVLNAGGAADLSQVQLMDARAENGLQNGDFSLGMAHWLPCAQSYFLPWHIDNLWLELLLEQGAIGLLLFAALMACALWLLRRNHAQPLAPYLAASLSGALMLGLVSSFLDVPRVAFLLLLLMLYAIESGLHHGARRGNE